MPKASSFPLLTSVLPDTNVYAFQGGQSYRTNMTAIGAFVESAVSDGITETVLEELAPTLANKANVSDVVAGLATKAPVNYQPTNAFTAQTISEKLRITSLHVKDFGAVPNVNVDQAPAINRAIDYYRSIDPDGSYGCVLHLGYGNYHLATPLTLHRALVFQGEGVNASGFSSQNVQWTSPAFLVNQEAMHFRDIQFNWDATSDTSTAPMMFVDGVQCRLHNTAMTKGLAPVLRSNGIIYATNVTFAFGGFTTATPGTSALITLEGTSITYMNGVRALSQGPNAFPGSGTLIDVLGARYVRLAGPVTADNIYSLIKIRPGSGEVREVFIDAPQLTSCGGAAISISPTGTGRINNVQIVAPRITNTTGDGIEIMAIGSGVIGTVQIVAPKITQSSGHGIRYQRGTLHVSDPQIAQNGGDGIRIGSTEALTGWSIVGGKLGPVAPFTANVGYGVNILAQAHDNFSVIGVDATGNSAGAVVDQSTGTSKFFMVHGYTPNVGNNVLYTE